MSFRDFGIRALQSLVVGKVGLRTDQCHFQVCGGWSGLIGWVRECPRRYLGTGKCGVSHAGDGEKGRQTKNTIHGTGGPWGVFSSARCTEERNRILK